jgi:hypothetical protein
MTLHDTMQHYTTVYKTIQHYNYKAIWHHTTPYNVIQDYTKIYKAIRHCTTLNTMQDYTTPYYTIADYNTGLQINIWLDRTFVPSLLILVGHNLNLVGQKPTPLYTSQDIYKSQDKYV